MDEREVDERELERIWQEVHAQEMQEEPEDYQHRDQTPDCPPLPRFREIVYRPSTQAPEERTHMAGCRYCQMTLRLCEQEAYHPAAEAIAAWCQHQGPEVESVADHLWRDSCERCAAVLVASLRTGAGLRLPLTTRHRRRAVALGAVAVVVFSGWAGVTGVAWHKARWLTAQQVVVQDLVARTRNATMDRVQQLENLLPQYRGSFSGLLSLCTAYVYSEQFARAIALCEQAQQIDPLHPEPYKLIAAIYKIQGLHEKSAASLKALLQKQQEAGVQEDADALTFLGWSYAVQGAYAEAKAAYTQARARLPGDADVAFNLALVYKQQGDDQKYKELLENAREFARRKIANNLQVAKSYFHLAKIYAHEKNWDQTLLNFNMAISRNVDWCFWSKHDSHFQDFFEVHPEFLRAIKVISDFYVGNKIQQTLVQLG